jgi:coenzyme PQQ precursor peptide PqqA
MTRFCLAANLARAQYCALVAAAAIKILKRQDHREDRNMTWQTPIVEEICVGMEVTSYESADLPPEF